MGAERHIHSDDPLQMFCEMFISQHDQLVNEHELARAFVEFFDIPPLTGVASLKAFFAQTKIELREIDLPLNLLGVNMVFEEKRRIDLSRNRAPIDFQVHTVLHELREIMEYEFCRSGFNTATSRDDLDAAANEFAFYAVSCSLEGLFKDLAEAGAAMESKWQRWATFGFVFCMAIFFTVHSAAGAFHPNITVAPSGIRPQK